METLELEVSDFTRRSGSVLVEHGATALRRGLDVGEAVLVRDGGRFYSATVADITFELTDTHYRLELGPEIDAEHAFDVRREALLAAASAPQGRVDTFELLALLRTARQLQQQASFVRGRVERTR